MELFKVFDCIPQDGLVDNKTSCITVLLKKTVTHINLYLIRYKQNVKITQIHSLFKTFLFALPQGSILGPILFNIFLNNLLPIFFFLEALQFTISAVSKDKNEPANILKKEFELTVYWFTQNKMIVNPCNF